MEAANQLAERLSRELDFIERERMRQLDAILSDQRLHIA